MDAARTGFNACLRATCKCFYLVECVLLHHQIINFQSLVARDGREFVQKFIDADADAEKVTKGFDANARAAKNGGAILNVGVYGDRGEVSHPTVYCKCVCK